MANVAVHPRIAGSIRLILAMFRLYADIETQFGKVIVDILKKQYPDQDVNEPPGRVGHKMMAIARRELQNNDSDAMDAIQEFLTYISTGSKTVKDEETGERTERTESKSWDFAKDWKTWQEALKAIYRNIKTTAISQSKNKMGRKKKEKGIDEAFGRKNDSGGFDDGTDKIPTGDETSLGKALDDKAAIKSFVEVIDDYLPELKASLPPEELVLWELIMEDEIGSFGSDIQENMGQATSLKEKMTEKLPEFVQKNEKRWSGAVGDLRKKLLDSIWKFIDNHMTPGDYDVMKETFFGDVDPSSIRKTERKKEEAKGDYQKGIDERKLARLKAKQESGEFTDKDQKEMDRLSEKLKASGVDPASVKADADAGAAGKKNKKTQTQESSSLSSMAIATVLASMSVVRPWLSRGS